MEAEARRAPIQDWLDAHRDRFAAIADEIWGYAEAPFHETKSSARLAQELAASGFRVQQGVGGFPTAFTAEWGEGHPVIGFIGEYDAVPGVSQKVSTVREPLVPVPGAYGHGCGHNLLGTGSAAAAIAVKQALEDNHLQGTIRFFGCPAEESGSAKVYMLRAGVFDGTDAMLGWHPAANNHVVRASTLAVLDSTYVFTGKTSHAGINPHLGRSALDGAILMDVGVNYLREHVTPDVRMHSTIPNGGGAPNVVPAKAEIHYMLRAPRRQEVDATHGWMQDIARGAALMARVSVEERFMSAASNAIASETLSKVLDEALAAVGTPGFDGEDYAFARALSEGISADDRRNSISIFGLPVSAADDILHNGIAAADDRNRVLPISGDSGDISWRIPMGRIFTCCQPVGVANHSWQQVACSGHSIGHKGMMFAAKCLALGALRLFEEPNLVVGAARELHGKTAASPYVSPIPEEVKVPPQMVVAQQ